MLIQKVAQFYPEYTAFQLAWKDKDNDLVAIKNDIATRHASGDVLAVSLLSIEKRNADEKVVGKGTQIAADQSDPHIATDQLKAQKELNQTKEGQDSTSHVGKTCDVCHGIVKECITNV